MNTASCRSRITFIDGDRGILRYRADEKHVLPLSSGVMKALEGINVASRLSCRRGLRR
jgi:hypothetical protein